MKTLYLVVVSVLAYGQLSGKIKNGYEPQLEISIASLQNLNLLLQDRNISRAKKVAIKSKIENLVNYISFYELTDEFIRQFKITSPVMFTEMDNIQDKRGRLTDVYVKLVFKQKSRTLLSAASFFQQTPTDEDANISVYGNYSVSVDICLVDNALFLLSHELGHIKYIVPNLATYSKFYKRLNAKSESNISYRGHSREDQSGRYAHIFEKRFLEERRFYFRNGGEKPMPLMALLGRIRKNTRNQETDYLLAFLWTDIR